MGIGQDGRPDRDRHQRGHQDLDQRIERLAPGLGRMPPQSRQSRESDLLEDQAEREQGRDHPVRRSVDSQVPPRAHESDDHQVGRADDGLRELDQTNRAAPRTMTERTRKPRRGRGSR